jgi:pimeloyl-ACP methyl ester carboxylesterase
MRKKIAFFLVFVFILGLAIIHFYVPRFVTEVKNPVLKLVRGEYQAEEDFGQDHSFEGKPLMIDTRDGIKISAYLTFASADPARGTIILLHGIRSGKDHYIPIAKFLAKNGYNSVAVDLRAHGESSGRFCTFGVKEKYDIHSVIDHLIKEENINNNLGVWGQSLGAAIALQTMAIDERIQFGIIESTFSDFRSTAQDYFRFHLGFNVPPFTNYLINRAGKISHFDPDEAVPKESCKKIHRRVLVVHGSDDKRINIRYGRENFENIPGKNKEFLTIENAAHLDVWQIGGDDYFRKVLAFIEREQ